MLLLCGCGLNESLRISQLPVVLETVQPGERPLPPRRDSALESAPSWAPILSAFLEPSLQCFTRVPCGPPEQSISWGARKPTGFCTPLRPIYIRTGVGREGRNLHLQPACLGALTCSEAGTCCPGTCRHLVTAWTATGNVTFPGETAQSKWPFLSPSVPHTAVCSLVSTVG